MKIKQWLFVGLLLSFASSSYAFLLPAEFILKNNTEHRKYLRRVTLQHQIDFLSGFFSPIPFSCKEKIFFLNRNRYRADYDCGGVLLTLLKINDKKQLIYNGAVQTLEPTPPHFLISLFLIKDADALIQNIHDHQFVLAEEVEPPVYEDLESDDPGEIKEEESKAKKKEEPKETLWRVTADVKRKRLEKISIGTPEKMEKNLIYVITSPRDSDKQLIVEKDLSLPLEIKEQELDFLFRNYREVKNKHMRFFRYPEKIEIQKAGVAGVLLTSEFKAFEVNPKYPDNFFNANEILKSRTTMFPKNLADSSARQETIGTFVKQFR